MSRALCLIARQDPPTDGDSTTEWQLEHGDIIGRMARAEMRV